MNIGGDLLQFSTVSPLNATTQESQVLEQDVDQFDLSARAHKNILCVARTIADLADSVRLGSSCLVETIQYRNMGVPSRLLSLLR